MTTVTSLSARAAVVYDNINAASSPDILNNIVRAIWHDWGKGAFTDEEASFLTAAIDRRRLVTSSSRSICKIIGRLSRFKCRQRPRSPDRKASRDRRRILAGSSSLP